MSEKLLLMAPDDYVSITVELPHTMVITFSDGSQETYGSTVSNTPNDGIAILDSRVVISGPQMPIDTVTFDGAEVDFVLGSNVEFGNGAEFAPLDASLSSIVAHQIGEF